MYFIPLPSCRYHLSYDDCLYDKRGKLWELLCAVLYTTVVYNDTYEQFLKMSVGFGFCLAFCVFSGLA